MTVTASDHDSAIRCEALTKVIGTQRILDGITLDVPRGAVVGVLGPSGSGKSTLLRCLNWLSPPTSGQVWLHGELLSERRIRAQRSRIGMVFQSFNLWPHMTALENVMEGLLGVRRMPRLQALEVASQALRQVGLAGKHHHHPAQLSGGQQQRVSIARAIAMAPDVLLFDEPTSALDPELVGEVLQVMRTLAAASTTMLVVTHEIAFAREACNHVVFMDQGRILEQGAPDEVLHHPREERTRRFFERFIGNGNARQAA